MKKAILGIVVLLWLTSCGQSSYTDASNSYKLPSELSNCRIYRLESSDMSRDITIVHCPHAETTTSYTESCGKNCTRQVNNIVASD